MLPKDRVLNAFEHRPTDRVPIYQAGFSSRAASLVLGHEAYVGGGMQQWRESKALWEGEDAHQEFLERSQEDARALPKALDLDIIRPTYWRMSEKPVKKIDEHTFMYGDPETSWRVMRVDPRTELYQVVEQHPNVEPTMEDLERQVESAEKGLDAYQPKAASYAAILDAQENDPDRAVLGSGVGVNIPYKVPRWLEAIALRPDIVKRHMMVQAERGVRNANCQAELGLRFLAGGGDFASNKGPFYSPAAFHEMTLPALEKVSEACHANEQFHMFASDGNLWPVADDLFGAAGVDCFYEIDCRAGMHLDKLRERFPHLTLMGGVNSFTLHRGTKEEVVEETRQALEVAKEKGSTIVGCSNQVIAETPPENFWAMMDTLHEHR